MIVIRTYYIIYFQLLFIHNRDFIYFRHDQDAMNRKETIFGILENHQIDLRTIGVKNIGVFGSVLRGEDTGESDYDILVEFEPDHHNFRNYNRLCDFLEMHLGGNFDLVTKQGLSPYIGKHILKEVRYVPIAS